MWSGEMTNRRLVTELEATRPGLMVLANSSQELPYSEFLRREYRMTYEDADVRLYV
jgi:hypothetical protein